MRKATSMIDHVIAYLKQRRHLGYQLKVEGEQLLRFAQFADERGSAGKLTIDLALAWANASTKASPLGKARRLEVVRCFAKHRFIQDPATEIPPPGLLGPAHRRIVPHIFSEQEIKDLLHAALQLEPIYGLRPVSIQTLLALLACTGLRISEALRLNCDDIDWQQGILTIMKTKFNKSRLIPLHSSALAALKKYKSLRDNYAPLARSNAFFLLDDGTALTIQKAEYAFICLRKKLHWDQASQGRKPRLYDLRHTFVCHRLLAWYEEGVDINRMIPHLSTYVGHVKVANTYWYITAIPELMAIATKRFEYFAQNLLGERI